MLLPKIIKKAIAEITSFLLLLKRKINSNNNVIPNGEKIVGSNLVNKYVMIQIIFKQSKLKNIQNHGNLIKLKIFNEYN